ncbi:hypothetical protein CROQUDRAFT_90241 [Cronartium quercuum f. sp. fusiforme G11]|uniref:Uncharacterized protein n=1 Tax=Cronartium quercuum f. sp. fusiforme G11 TaxID=708437 RepID=A0A9P6TDK1_9BASI|nr:hypothetical protein CROQUDRAFT_90241 [Cronartium quercuum f. sp. fusiforme G11]
MPLELSSTSSSEFQTGAPTSIEAQEDAPKTSLPAETTTPCPCEARGTEELRPPLSVAAKSAFWWPRKNSQTHSAVPDLKDIGSPNSSRAVHPAWKTFLFYFYLL